MCRSIDFLSLRQTRRFVLGVPDIGSILGQLRGNGLLLGVEEGHRDKVFASKHKNSRPCVNRCCRDGHWALVTMVNERSCHLVSAKRIAAGAFVPWLPSENQSLCLVRTEIQGNQQA